MSKSIPIRQHYIYPTSHHGYHVEHYTVLAAPNYFYAMYEGDITQDPGWQQFIDQMMDYYGLEMQA